jgi:[phosphatase 2A protein]-leucine-carboxy methyltransferase
VEIDFPSVTSTKAQRISLSPRLTSSLGQSGPRQSNPAISSSLQSGKPYRISQGGTRLSSEVYELLPLDLRSNPLDSLTTHLAPLLDPEVPTLFLAECVFCYMRPGDSMGVIKWFGERFEKCVGVVYEMCGLEWVLIQSMKEKS